MEYIDIKEKKDVILYTLRDEYNNIKEFFHVIKDCPNPKIYSREINHVARFQKINDYWLSSKYNLENQDQIDIVEYMGGYLYYITENGLETIIYSRDLFYDFNKCTNHQGNVCRLNDASCRLKSNLIGYYWETEDLSGELIRCDYFRNFFGNVYNLSTVRDDTIMLRVVNFRRGRIDLLADIIEREESLYTGKLCNYETYLEQGLNISKPKMDIMMTDIIDTNPNDVSDIKKILELR